MELMLNGREATLSDFVADDLPRAVVNSLFSWARARDDDELPGVSRFGWWGDSFAADEGDRFGSRLWLLSREKMTSDVPERAREYCEEALQWLIDDGVASGVSVTAERGQNDRLDLTVVSVRPGEQDLTARFFDVWSALS